MQILLETESSNGERLSLHCAASTGVDKARPFFSGRAGVTCFVRGQLQIPMTTSKYITLVQDGASEAWPQVRCSQTHFLACSVATGPSGGQDRRTVSRPHSSARTSPGIRMTLASQGLLCLGLHTCLIYRQGATSHLRAVGSRLGTCRAPHRQRMLH